VPAVSDNEPETFNLDPQRLEDAIGPRTRAIMPVHLYGQCADMDPILEIARRRRLHVVEDAAQAVLARDRDRQAGTMGAIGCLSFYPTKNLSAFGDAGACLTNDPELDARLRRLRQHGESRPYVHEQVGGNFRLDALQARMLEIKLPHLEPWTRQRGRLACRYHDLLENLPVTPPPARAGVRHVYHQYTIRVPDGRREGLRAFLAERAIGSRVYYPLALHRQPCFEGLSRVGPGGLEQADRAADEVLSLPLYPGLSEKQQDEVASAIAAFYR